METGLYFPLRFFNHTAGEVELTLNGEYCKHYEHIEYVCLPPVENKILPFCLVMPSIVSFSSGNAVVKMVCHENDEEETLVMSAGDWSTEVYDDKTYIFYSAIADVSPSVNPKKILPGTYYFRITITIAGTQYKFYSDIFRLTKTMQ